MPRLLALLPCNYAIISRDDNSVSLINVMQGVTAALPQGAVGQNVLLPNRWAVFAYWLKEPSDGDQEFEQRLELVAPSNETVVAQESTFRMTQNTHSQVGHVLGMPITNVTAGSHAFKLRLSLRNLGAPTFTLVW